MNFQAIIKAACLGLTALGLAACSGSGTTGAAPTSATTTSSGTTTSTGSTTSTGTTPTGPSSQSAFDPKSTSYIFLVSTTTPLSGSADYTGEISVLTQANAADAREAVIGNLDMNVNFGAGVTNPVTATASNFTGNVNGVATTIGGTLSTANAVGGDANSVTAQTTGVGTLTSATATLRGTMTDPTGALSGNARMILNGNFKEANGDKISGGHQTTITPAGGGTSIATGGTLYADKK